MPNTAVQMAVRSFGKLTTLVNVAAAVTPDGTVETLTLEDWTNAIAINLTGAFLTCKYAVPEIRRAGGGTIVNIASQLGQIGVPGRAPYSSSKAALIQFTTCIAGDHAKDNIRVNSLSPGGVDTERTVRRWGSREAANRARGPGHLLGRTGRGPGDRGRCSVPGERRIVVHDRRRSAARRRLSCLQGLRCPIVAGAGAQDPTRRLDTFDVYRCVTLLVPPWRFRRA